MAQRDFQRCRINEYWLDDPVLVKSKKEGTLRVGPRQISWQPPSGDAAGPGFRKMLTDYTCLYKFKKNKKRPMFKMSIRDASRSQGGIILAFADDKTRDEAEALVVEYWTQANAAAASHAHSAGPLSSFRAVTSSTPRVPKSGGGDNNSNGSPSAHPNNGVPNGPTVAISEATRKRREDWLKSNPRLNKEHAMFVPAFVSEEEFWQQRESQLALQDAEAAAEEDVSSTRLDPGFSLLNIRNDGNGEFVFNSTTIPKVFKLYPWLQGAYDEQVTRGNKSVAEFFTDFASHIMMDDHCETVSLDKIGNSSFATFKSVYDKMEIAKSQNARDAKVTDLASEVPGEYNLMATVGDQSLKHSSGYGVPGLSDGFLSSGGRKAGSSSAPSMSFLPSSSSSSSSSAASSSHQSQINRRSQMALRELLENNLDRKMRAYWFEEKDEAGISTGEWKPLADVQGKKKASLLGLAKLVKGFEPPPQRCNGLGLGGPPRRAVDYTCKLYDALNALSGGSGARSQSRVLPLPAVAFLRHFDGQFLGNKRRRPGAIESAALEGRGKLIRQHPDLQRSEAFEVDHTRFETIDDVGDRLLHRKQKKRKMGAARAVEGERDASEVTAAPSSQRHESHFGVDREEFTRFGRIERSRSSSYLEPEQVVALEVFRATMQRIKDQADPFARSNASGGTCHELESFKTVHEQVTGKKRALTELLRLFWRALGSKDRAKAANLSQRIESFDKSLTAWRQGLPNAETVRLVEPFLSTMRDQVGAVRARYQRLEQAQARRDQKMRARTKP